VPALEIVQPAPGSVFVLAPELEDQVLLRAVAPGAETIRFLLDGVPIGGAESSDASLPWTLVEGEHLLEVLATGPDGLTRRATTTFEVRGQ
jgi:hypothetical protein